MNKENDYSKDLSIDRYDLLGEWVNQPELYDNWAKKWANAEYRVDKLRSKRKWVKAVIADEVNSDPSHFGWKDNKSPTGLFIDSIIRRDPRFIDIDRKYNKAVWSKNLMEVAKTSFLHRRKALEYISDLYMSSHYHIPSVPQNVQKEIEKESRSEELERLQRYKNVD